MSKLLVLHGIPASGKSTYAKKLVQDSGNYARLNRDSLREMLYNGNWTREREKVIIEVEKAMAKALLNNNQSVIVDDTNFKNVWKDFWKTEDIDPFTAYEDRYFNTPLEECIQRDKNRAAKGEPSVGQNVITKMALRNGLVQFPDLPIVLVDIDGTTAASTGRERYLSGPTKDWKSYYEALDSDVPVVSVFAKVAQLSKNHTIIIVSGRGAEYQEQTRAWFNKVWESNPLFPELEVPKFPIFLWLFRDAGDHRDDTIVKKEFLNLLPKHLITKVLDDRPKVCRMWEEEGLDVEWVRGKDLEDF